MQEDIHDQLDPVPLPEAGVSTGMMAAGVLLLLTVIVLVVWRLRRRTLRRQRPAETAEHRARRRMAAIGTADCRAFHAQLSSILVEYFEERIALRSTRLTSAEIVREFRGNGVMSAAWQNLLEELFQECDRAKFSASECEWDAADALAKARRILDELAAQAAAAPVLANPWKGWTNARV